MMKFAAGALTGIAATYLFLGYAFSMVSPMWMYEGLYLFPIFSICHFFNRLGGL